MVEIPVNLPGLQTKSKNTNARNAGGFINSSSKGKIKLSPWILMKQNSFSHRWLSSPLSKYLFLQGHLFFGRTGMGVLPAYQ
jgi:hypothetical protein